MLRAAGIVALIVLTACGQNNPVSVASPSPVIAAGNWTQNLTFSGGVVGQMTGIVADTGDQVSGCTGSKTRNGEQWADTFYATVGVNPQVWEIGFVVNNFRGPGLYRTTDATIVVRSLDKKRVWLNISRDKVTFTLSASQQSGTVDASLTDATTGKPGLKITGQWNCQG
jgi:hypothetical protein